MLPPWCLGTGRASDEAARSLASTTPGPFSYPVAIIGGGLAGLCTSVGLTHLKVPHTIYEAKESFGELGFGVAYSPNAAAALALIDPELRRCYNECAIVEPDPEHASTWLNYRVGITRGTTASGQEMSFGELIANVRATGYGGKEQGRASVHRAEFLNKIIQLIPKGVAKFNKKVVGMEEIIGAVRLTFSDDTVELASAVVACDGIWSLARQVVLESTPHMASAVFAGEYCYRRLIPREEAEVILGKDLAGSGNIFCGYGTYVTTYPVGGRGASNDAHKGTFVNVVAIRQSRDESWPMQREASSPGDQHTTRPQLVTPSTIGQMLADFEGWAEPIRQLLAGIENPQRWALCHAPPTPAYYRGRICLLGDAAHASTPHQGAGAGMAAEDAYLVASLLAQVHSSDEVESAFHAFDSIQRARGNRLVETSREASQLFSFELCGDDLRRVKENLLQRHDWIWKIDLEEQQQNATTIQSAHAAAKRMRQN